MFVLMLVSGEQKGMTETSVVCLVCSTVGMFSEMCASVSFLASLGE